MTGSSSKLLQIQGKWYREKSQNKNPKPEAKKKQKLFYTLTNRNAWIATPKTIKMCTCNV